MTLPEKRKQTVAVVKALNLPIHQEARNKLMAGRTNLVLRQPFFGALSLRLTLFEDPSCETAWVDGTTLGYNPEFIMTLQHPQVIALVAHEVMHCACGHPWRRDLREPFAWNVACDLVINPILDDAQFQLPQGALRDPQYKGKSAEWVYARLPRVNVSGSPGGALGEVRDAPCSEACSAGTSEADWQAAVQQAAQAAQAQGKLPASLERFVGQCVAPRVDWRSVLRRFISEVAKADYSFSRPSPRYAASGLYLPSLRSEEMGPVVVAIDTSGSIDAVLLNQFFSEVNAIAEEAQPVRVHVMYCDAKLHRADTFERGDVIEAKPVGGGGTDFRPVFAALDTLEEAPVAVIYLTDLAGTFPSQPCETPTLWASIVDSPVPFGEVVLIQ